MRIADLRLILCVVRLLIIAPAAGVPVRVQQGLSPEPAREATQKVQHLLGVPTPVKRTEERTTNWSSVLASNRSVDYLTQRAIITGFNSDTGIQYDLSKPYDLEAYGRRIVFAEQAQAEPVTHHGHAVKALGYCDGVGNLIPSIDEVKEAASASYEQAKALLKEKVPKMAAYFARAGTIVATRAANAEALNLRTSTSDWPVNGSSPLCKSLVRELREAQENMDYLVNGPLSILDTALTRLNEAMNYLNYATLGVQAAGFILDVFTECTANLLGRVRVLCGSNP